MILNILFLRSNPGILVCFLVYLFCFLGCAVESEVDLGPVNPAIYEVDLGDHSFSKFSPGTPGFGNLEIQMDLRASGSMVIKNIASNPKIGFNREVMSYVEGRWYSTDSEICFTEIRGRERNPNTGDFESWISIPDECFVIQHVSASSFLIDFVGSFGLQKLERVSDA